MYNFTWHHPGTLETVQQLLRQAEDGTVIAGGMTLLATLKQRLASPSDLVDLSGVSGLSEIEDEGAALRIGAMAPHAEVAAHPQVQQRCPALAALAGQIGDPQVRHRGTLGGSVANNDPAADYPAAVLALGATILTDRREIAAESFFQGMFATALEQGEIITAVRFPIPQAAGWAKVRNPASRYALAGAFVAQTAGGVRVAITGAGPGVFRLEEAEKRLTSAFSVEALEGLTLSAAGLNGDLHASPDYRAHLVPVVVRRAVKSALPAEPHSR